MSHRMWCTAGCTQKCKCKSFDEGVLQGKTTKIKSKYRNPISVIFQTLLKKGKINGMKPAVELADFVLTFYQLEEFSTSMALDLRDRIGLNYKIKNPDNEPIIATCIPNSAKAVVIILAILKTGAAYLPLDEDSPESVLLEVIKAFQPLMLIADDNGALINKLDTAKFNELPNCKFITVDELWIAMEVPNIHKEKTRRNSVIPQILEVFPLDSKIPAERRTAAVFHTRGLHNNPMGVRLTHLAIVNRCLFDYKRLHVKQNESCSLGLCFSLPDSIPQLFVPLLRGCTLHIFRRQDLNDMGDFIKTAACHNINRLSIPYFHFRDFLEAIDNAGRKEVVDSLKCVKHVISRGGFLRAAEVVQFFGIFKRVTLYNCNGHPETCCEVFYERFHSLNDYRRRRVFGRLTLGLVLDNVRIYILGEKLGIFSDGRQGEICISGLCLSVGYVGQENLPEAQKNMFVKNPHDNSTDYGMLFRSGDYGRIMNGHDGKRCILVEGRDDRLVNRHGHEFSTEDVRMRLQEMDFAKQVFVFVLHKGKITQEMVGLIEPKGKGAPDSIEIEFNLRKHLPEWALPDEIMVVTDLPVHASGKVCPCCLLHKFLEQRHPRGHYLRMWVNKRISLFERCRLEVQAWERLSLPHDQKDAAEILVKGVFKFTSVAIEFITGHLNQSYFDIGGTSVTAIALLVYINKRGYPVTLKEFYQNPILNDFIKLMAAKLTNHLAKRSVPESDSATSVYNRTEGIVVKPNFHVMTEMKEDYIVEILKKKHRNATIELLATAYCEKGDLQGYNIVSYEHMSEFLRQVWQAYEEEQYSLVVIKKSNKKVVAALICQDFFKLIDTNRADGSMYSIMELYHEVKGHVLPFVPHRTGDTLEVAWMATLSSLHPMDSVKLITLLHTELIKFGHSSGNSFIFYPTVNMLSRSLCKDVFGYKLLEDFQVNQYQELDGSRPFHLAGDVVACAAFLLQLKDPEETEGAGLTDVDAVKYFNKISNKGLEKMTSYGTPKIPEQPPQRKSTKK